MRLLVGSLLLLDACLLGNPDFGGADEGGSTAASSTTTTGSGTSTTASGPTGDSGSEGSGSASEGATTSTSTSTSASTMTTTDGTSSATTGQSPAPKTLKPYSTCERSFRCVFENNELAPAWIRAVECFSVDVEPPFELTRVGFSVRYIIGTPQITLSILPFDAANRVPIFAPIHTLSLGATGQAIYHTFDLNPPLAVGVKDFCVVIEGGDQDSTLALGIDDLAMAPFEAFVSTDGPGGGCDHTLLNLKDLYQAPTPQYCIDADLVAP